MRTGRGGNSAPSTRTRPRKLAWEMKFKWARQGKRERERVIELLACIFLQICTKFDFFQISDNHRQPPVKVP